jgi:hypothetical protein
MRKHTSFSVTEFPRVVLCEGLDELFEQLSDLKARIGCFDQLHSLLEALPLDTTQFGLAVNRLANARHYVESGEYGAARYELRLLRQSLER